MTSGRNCAVLFLAPCVALLSAVGRFPLLQHEPTWLSHLQTLQSKVENHSVSVVWILLHLVSISGSVENWEKISPIRACWEDQLDQASATAKAHSKMGICRVCLSALTTAYDWMCGATESLTKLSNEYFDLGSKRGAQTPVEIRDWEFKAQKRRKAGKILFQSPTNPTETSMFWTHHHTFVVPEPVTPVRSPLLPLPLLTPTS